MVEPILEPFAEIVRVKDGIETQMREIEAGFKENPFTNIVFGIEHENLPQAILADLVDALPIVGEISDVSRIRLADEKARRFMHSIDLAVDILPPPISTVADLLLPTNTLWYLEKKVKGK